MQSLKIVTTTLDMKQGQLGAGLHHLGGALESGLSEVFITICITHEAKYFVLRANYTKERINSETVFGTLLGISSQGVRE